ncbi:YhjD/YihY/BrkB family envelope integrity protein [Corynebacterium pilosum]|uniref:Multiple transmembrane domain containing protein n=1 Tax=Corynebacterium pilosum TaxID=35756 RepID=A0A376CNG1_9CORY|nr:YhjD/YihY/BrkB family envelope integrity protein [Corynebacterium pilosum]STC69747.1 multiple transmembrane domain containing protein [Corynebacterium pilosum]
MSTRTSPNEHKLDDYGIEREHKDDESVVEKVRDEAPVVDHLMRMQDRFGKGGGNQYSAGITYFSVMSVFPLAMLLFGTLALFLAGNPDLLDRIQTQITESVDGDLGELVNSIIDQAIAARGAVLSVGALTALWSGLGWINNLRAGVGAMWNLAPTEGGNFVVKKLRDLVALIGLIIALGFAFIVTAIGSSSFTTTVLERFWPGDNIPGLRWIIFGVAIVLGIAANFLVMFWIQKMLPRTHVPTKSALKGALLGAIIFEILKQFSTVIISSATSNPAGAAFGPIITLMVLLYLIWRVVLYVAAWTATTEEALEHAPVDVPDSAVIRVRSDISASAGQSTADSSRTFGIGAIVGALIAGIIAVFGRK